MVADFENSEVIIKVDCVDVICFKYPVLSRRTVWGFAQVSCEFSDEVK